MPSPHLGWSHSKNFYNIILFWTHLCQKSSSLDYTSKKTINVCHSLLFGIFIFIYICGMSACEYIYMWIYKICMYVSMYVCRYTCLWVYGGQRRVSDVYIYDPWQGLSLNPGFTSQLDWKPSSPSNNTVSILAFMWALESELPSSWFHTECSSLLSHLSSSCSLEFLRKQSLLFLEAA